MLSGDRSGRASRMVAIAGDLDGRCWAAGRRNNWHSGDRAASDTRGTSGYWQGARGAPQLAGHCGIPDRARRRDRRRRHHARRLLPCARPLVAELPPRPQFALQLRARSCAGGPHFRSRVVLRRTREGQGLAAVSWVGAERRVAAGRHRSPPRHRSEPDRLGDDDCLCLADRAAAVRRPLQRPARRRGGGDPHRRKPGLPPDQRRRDAGRARRRPVGCRPVGLSARRSQAGCAGTLAAAGGCWR